MYLKNLKVIMDSKNIKGIDQQLVDMISNISMISQISDIDDLIGIGTVGLIKGIDTYSMDKKVKLTTYAAKCAENEILMFFRNNN